MTALEIDIQQAFRKRLYYACPEARAVAVPNAARRTRWEAARAKKEGMAPGFPDIQVMGPGARIALIEFKTAKGRVSETQGEWHAWLDANGFPVAVCRSADAAMDFLRSLGWPLRERPA